MCFVLIIIKTDDYGALEPHISGKIMEIHHKGHHQTYVTNLNAALEQISEAKEKNNEIAAASLASALNFNGGGHTNHTLFWENLAPNNKGGGGEPEGTLKVSFACWLFSSLKRPDQ